MTLVLASGSSVRQLLLRNAGVRFEVDPADIDERAAEGPLLQSGAGPDDLALALAMAKAAHVSKRRGGDLVVGADQVLDLDGERFTKPENMDAARRQLLRLSGRSHQLHSALACARAGEVVWSHLSSPMLTMRPLEPAAVGNYLAEAGEAALSSVGAYQLEGPGLRLFEAIEGDYFAILGLPLLPLLAFLRAEGLVE